MSEKQKANILLVDDQPAKLLSYEVILADLDENLLKANSAREAFEILLKTEIAVVLVDVCMPDFDGFQLAAMIRDHPRFKETAIIFVSAVHMSEGDSLRGYEMGAVDYVSVPVVAGILRAKVRVFVDLYRKTKQLEQMNDALELRVAARTSELETAIERQELLSKEVDHRAKNALAVIQSIVSLTRADTAKDFAEAVHGRIRAMARAHTLLSQSRWDGADLGQLVEEEIAPYCQSERAQISGPKILLRPSVAQTLALAIHELATNAAKYGALSAINGRVAVRWILEPDTLTLDWSETGGPATQAPKKTGFGARLITTSVKDQLEGEVSFDWRHEGLNCRLTMPRAHFVTQAAPSDKPRATEDRMSAPQAPAHSARILLVEDEAIVALMMAEILRDLGMEVVGPYGRLAEAIAGAGREQIDCAILDVNLAGEPVFPLADALAAQGVPYIFVTGYEAAGLNAPAHASAPVLQKPIEPDTFRDTLWAQLAPEGTAPATQAMGWVATT